MSLSSNPIFADNKKTEIVLFSIITVLFFLAHIAIVSFAENQCLSYFWYAVNILISGIGFYKIFVDKQFNVFIFVLFIIVTSIICYLNVGNLSFSKYVFLTISVGTGYLLYTEKVSNHLFECIYYFETVFILIKCLIAGKITNVFSDFSNNYVSVVIIFPLVLYYLKSDNSKNRWSVFPAIIYFCISCLFHGRSGMLTGLALCFALILIKISKIKKKTIKIISYVLFLLITALALYFFLASFDTLVEKVPFLSHFKIRGFKSFGRKHLWQEYLTYSTANWKNFLLGSKLETMRIATKYDHNLHNSILNIHAYNGLIMFIFTGVLCCLAMIRFCKEKRPSAFVTFIVFMFRSAIDHVFWASYGTPVFFALIMISLIAKDKVPFKKTSSSKELKESI